MRGRCLVCGNPDGPVVKGFCSFECFFQFEESLEEIRIEVGIEELKEKEVVTA